MKMLLISATLLAASLANAETASPSPTPGPTPDWLKKADEERKQILAEERKTVDSTLALYQELKGLNLEASSIIVWTDPKFLNERMELAAKESKDPIMWELEHPVDSVEISKHQKRTPIWYELKLNDWVGTITYHDGRTGKIIATTPARVFVSKDSGEDDGPSSFVVRISVGSPHSNERIAYYARSFFEKDFAFGW